MAYTLMTECGHCGRPFTCNPDIVPVLKKELRNETGELVRTDRLVLCRPCAYATQRQLEARGIVTPEIPHNAYEPAGEPGDR